MSKQIYDVIVVGTGAGGGMAIKTLCEAGLRVCALNSGRALDPAKDFRNHRMPWELKYRGFGDPKLRQHAEAGFVGDTEYVQDVWEREFTYTTAPGTSWSWPRCSAVGGKTNFWGRSSARFADIDFRAASLDGHDVDWPVAYEEIAPYYTRVEEMIGVASTVQNRPSNPDGHYLPPMNFRCFDMILQAGAKKVGVPYLPDRIAQLTVEHDGHPACHFCGDCTSGCEVGAFFSTPWFLLPKAAATGNLELRTNAIAKNVTTDQNGNASGIRYVDRETKREYEVYGRAVVMAASCLETARIMLNSKSGHWPTGIANSSGQLGRNLCDHLYGTAASGYLPQLLGQASFPDNVSDSSIAWMPRWQNLNHPQEEKFVRGYSVYPDGGCWEFPIYYDQIEGFGSSFKREMKRRYPTPVTFMTQIPSLPSASNFVDIDPVASDSFAIPKIRIHFKWGDNELQMWKHAKKACADVLESAGGILESAADEPETPGYSQHEVGTCRMGNDPKSSVTNRFGQTHDVANLFVCDSSVFANCTDKTPLLSILAFSLRTSEYIMEQFRRETLPRMGLR
ncbi:MAG: GMC family oxidoreductase [Acidobacteria bacterium]|nr:GMC family oxidoreductase [Acidobacteriota bacterium]